MPKLKAVFRRVRLHNILFLCFTLISAVPVLFLSVWVQRSALDKEIAAVEEKHLLLARNLTQALERYVRDVESGFELRVSSLKAGNQLDGISSLLEDLHIRSVQIVDSKGNIKKSPGAQIPAGGEKFLKALMPKLLAEWRGAAGPPQEVYFSNVAPGSGGKPSIFLIKNLPGKLFAVGELDTDYILEMQRNIAFGKRGHAAIVDRTGRVLAHPNAKWRSSSKDISQVKPVRRMMAGETGVTQFYSPAVKADMIAGYTHLPRVGWGVMIPQPIEELEARAADVRLAALAVALLGIVFAGLISWWLARYLVRPIRAVMESARQVGAGELSTRVPEFRYFVPQELRELSDSFNRMIDEMSAKNAAIHESAARLADAQRIAGMGHWEWNLEKNELWWSDSLYDLLGIDPPDAPPTMATFESTVHPDDLGMVSAVFGQALWKGNPLDIVYRVLAADGNERVVHTRGETQYNEQGRPVRMSGTTHDITERRREEALRESEERFRSLVGQAADAFFLHDADGKIVDVNDRACESLGYKREELLELTMPDIDEDFGAESFRDLMKSVKPGQPHTYNGSHRQKDGTTIPVEVRTGVIDSGGQQLMLALARDISQRKLLEQQLLQSQKMEAIGTLAGGIAHDFNNILAPIIGYTELTLEKLDPGSSEHSDLSVVRDSAHRAKEIVSQILQFSRKSEDAKDFFDLRPHVIESVKFLRSTLPKSIDIQERISADPLIIFGNATQIHQVLINLCVNASQAMPGGGKLSITLDARELGHLECFMGDKISGNYIRLAITDSGVGMDRSTIQHIFEPFFTTKPVGSGTGLGLSTALGIISQHGGAMNVNSHPGEGATFEVYLPQKDWAADVPKVEFAAQSGGSASILFVDDEPHIVDYARKTLESLGYQVTALTSSLEALKKFRASPEDYQLVVTDQMMPEMTGEVLVNELRSIRADIPIVLCTGYSDAITPEKAKLMGLNDFVYKPITPDELMDIVRRVLSQIN
ncbi:MAG: PAS domain S-box protein [SAR324 cluster bacterium]|nr:PAS domain S-box protein [SAR324 cluster bacterium]